MRNMDIGEVNEMKFGKYSPDVSQQVRGGWLYLFKFKAMSQQTVDK